MFFGKSKSSKEVSSKEVKSDGIKKEKAKRNIFDEIDEASSGPEMTKEERDDAKKKLAEYLS